MWSSDHVIFDYGTFGQWGGLGTNGFVITADQVGPRATEEEINIKRAGLEKWIMIPAHHPFD